MSSITDSNKLIESKEGRYHENLWFIANWSESQVMLNRALWDPQARRPFCPPFLASKTPASITVSEFQRAEELLIKRGAATKPPEARLKGLEPS